MKNLKTKICGKCKKELPVSLFGSQIKKTGNGRFYEFRRPICKDCRSQEGRTAHAKKIESRTGRYCEICGRLLPKLYSQRRYCSRECAYKAKHPAKNKVCLQCGREFEARLHDQKYCSKACYKCFLARAHQKAVKRCEFCGKDTTRRRYCSPECWKQARASKNAESKKRYFATEKGKTCLANKNRIGNASRRARHANTERSFTVKDWRAALDYFNHKCAYCGKPLDKVHQEHFVPLSKGGAYTKKNIVPACPDCNKHKRNLNPLDWLVTQAKGLVAYVRVTQYLESA